MLQVLSYVAVYAVLYASPKCQVTKALTSPIPTSAAEVGIGEVNELEGDVGDVLSEVDQQANTADKYDDHQIDEDLAEIGIDAG